MQDILKDIVAHTHALGFLTLVKITADEEDGTIVESMTDDRSVILKGTTHSAIDDFDGVFGMPNLDKLALLLKNPEYKKDAKITVINSERNGVELPVHMHFENAAGDFENDYRFMNQQIIDERLKSVKFKGATWALEFEPSMASIGRMKLQSAAHNEEVTFNVNNEDNDLIFSFGDESTHAGKFTFATDVGNKLKKRWSWPVAQTISILSLDGKLTVKISDQGAMMIEVDSGLAKYEYILPAQVK